MLTSSEYKLHRNPYFVVGIVILGLLVALATPLWNAIPAFSSSQDLTALSASEASAYRWQAAAGFYQEAGIPVTGESLAALSTAEVSAYRWQAMAAFYLGQAQPEVKYGPPGR